MRAPLFLSPLTTHAVHDFMAAIKKINISSGQSEPLAVFVSVSQAQTA